MLLLFKVSALAIFINPISKHLLGAKRGTKQRKTGFSKRTLVTLINELRTISCRMENDKFWFLYSQQKGTCLNEKKNN